MLTVDPQISWNFSFPGFFQAISKETKVFSRSSRSVQEVFQKFSHRETVSRSFKAKERFNLLHFCTCNQSGNINPGNFSHPKTKALFPHKKITKGPRNSN
eukprot:GFUD01139383.1.p1 GENE.GFUD01139383.1~~GFUD01139383.1.p1  ORF type:complete len:100 (+),score=8.48 GFUD01139383.1:79-378(+)